MSQRTKPYYKWVAAFVIVVLTVQMFLFSIQGMGLSGMAKVEQLIEDNADDRRIAAELSNMTGVATEDIIALREDGLSWNQVVDVLKSQDGDTAAARGERSSLLAAQGLDEATIRELKEQGFREQEITEARLLAERVRFQLNEIVQAGSDGAASLPDPAADAQTALHDEAEDAEEMEHYRQLAAKFDVNRAVYLMLVLKKDFGGLQQVLDEYLFCLQAELDLNLYLEDKTRYEEEKREKQAQWMPGELITTAKIEQKMLETIEKENQLNRNEEENPASPASSPAGMPETENPLAGCAIATGRRCGSGRSGG